MPIQGLSTRDVIQPRFRTLGKLRKGAEKTGNRPGRDLDYFRFVPDNGRADIREAFVKAYGEKPDRLEVFFPFPTMEENFRSWREAYGKNHLCKLRCDGALWHDWIEGDRHYHDEQGRECAFKYRDTDNRCPQCPLGYYGYLDVILPGMWYNGQVGLVTVLTTAINDIAALSAKLVQWEPLNNKPFVIWREFKTIGIPVNGNRVAKDVSLIHLELAEQEMVKAFLSAQPDRVLIPETADAPGEDIIADYDQELAGDDPFLVERGHRGASMDADAYEDYQEVLEDESAQAEVAVQTPVIRRWPDETINAIVNAKIAAPAKHAVHMLNLSKVLRTTDEVEFVMVWAGYYRSARDDGETPEDAAKWADEQMPTGEVE